MRRAGGGRARGPGEPCHMDPAQTTDTLGRHRRTLDEFRRLRAAESRVPRMERVVAEFAGLDIDRPASFNAFEVLRIGPDEVVHSGVLAWLLDARAGHAMGPLFLNRMTTELGLPISVGSRDRYVVRREFSGPFSIVDVCVYRPHDFLLYIENKILAAEGPRQAELELRDMDRTGEANGIPAARRHAVFLTPDGRPPTSGDSARWLCLSYARLAAAFGAALPSLGDDKLANFVGDWLQAVSSWGAEP